MCDKTILHIYKNKVEITQTSVSWFGILRVKFVKIKLKLVSVWRDGLRRVIYLIGLLGFCLNLKFCIVITLRGDP